MTTDDSYNGYTNKETWGIALIIDNDEGLYLQSMEMAQEAQGDASFLARCLEEWVDDMAFIDDSAGTSSLLLNAWTDWCARVDWHELAGNYLENAKELAE